MMNNKIKKIGLIFLFEVCICALLIFLSEKYREYLHLEYSVDQNVFQNNPVTVLVLIIMIGISAVAVFAWLIYSVVDRERALNIAIGEITSTLNMTNLGVVNYDKNGKILYGNKGFFEMIGVDRQTLDYEFEGSMAGFVSKEAFLELTNDVLPEGKNERKTRIRLRNVRNDSMGWFVVCIRPEKRKLGTSQFFAVLQDITREKEMQERLEREERKYRIVSDISKDIMFEYKQRTDTIEFSGRYEQMYANGNTITNFVEQLKNGRSHVHPDDVGVIVDHMSLEGTYEFDFRMLDENDEYVWCHLIGTSVTDANMKKHIVGKWYNIDMLKKEMAALEEQATTDPLTGAYNRSELFRRVSEALRTQPDKTHVYVMLDVDDFKKINDKYGHLFGDEILINLVTSLKNVLRGNEFISRFGGDEFVIFIEGLKSKEELEMRLRTFFNTAAAEFVSGSVTYKVSVSMGVACNDKENMTSEALAKNADAALYDVKNRGKSGRKIYE